MNDTINRDRLKKKLKLDAQLLSTINCNHDFSCLNENDTCVCEIDFVVNDAMFFVKAKNYKHCNHMHSFGFSHYCTCEIRKLLFKNLQI